jgi:Mn2+/Fe2+ NRAMP family transporter
MIAVATDRPCCSAAGAAVAFALTLLAAGLASSSVGTYADQVITEGFLRRRVRWRCAAWSPWCRPSL